MMDSAAHSQPHLPANNAVPHNNAAKDLSPAAPQTDEALLNMSDLANLTQLAQNGAGIERLNDVDLDVKIELGRTQLTVEQILKLGEGAVVELDKLAGDPVDVLVNGQLIARGEVLVVNDNFCVRINEILPGVSEAAKQV